VTCIGSYYGYLILFVGGSSSWPSMLEGVNTISPVGRTVFFKIISGLW